MFRNRVFKLNMEKRLFIQSFILLCQQTPKTLQFHKNLQGN